MICSAEEFGAGGESVDAGGGALHGDADEAEGDGGGKCSNELTPGSALEPPPNKFRNDSPADVTVT